MPFRVFIGDVPVEADTEEELRTLLRLFELLPSSGSSKQIRSGRQPRLPLANRSLKIRLRALFESLESDSSQRVLLEALAANSEGLLDKQIRHRLGIRSNTHLAGVMAGLSKNARNHEVHLEDVLLKENTEGIADVLYRYSLSPVMQEVMQDLGYAKPANTEEEENWEDQQTREEEELPPDTDDDEQTTFTAEDNDNIPF